MYAILCLVFQLGGRGTFFVTLVCKGRRRILSTIRHDRVYLTEVDKIVENHWLRGYNESWMRGEISRKRVEQYIRNNPKQRRR